MYPSPPQQNPIPSSSSLSSPSSTLIPQLQSSAFPSTKTPIRQSSVFHQILQYSTKKTISDNITFRLTNKESDIKQIWNFQLELFPLAYGETFYSRILAGRYRCLVAEALVEIQALKLKEILSQRQKKEKQAEQAMIKSGQYRNPVFVRPSAYFLQQQPQMNFYLLNQTSTSSIPSNKQQQQQKHNIKLEQQPSTHTPVIYYTRIRIIVGITIFDLISSQGYLKSSWLSQTLFSQINSVYINTIGVLQQYRKHGLARKMLQWVITKAKSQQMFKLVYLHVIQYNQPAIKLYRKLGFVEFEEISGYYHVEGKEYKAKVLGFFINGGERRVGWGDWIRSLWK